MRHVKNPFDRDPRSVPLIRFMLHTKSLSSEILLRDSPAHRLIKLNSLNEVGIISLPIADHETRRILNASDVVLTEYSSDERTAVLRASDGSTHDVVSRFTRRLPENLWSPIISDSEVVLADLYASRNCDYLVVGANDPSLKCKVAGDTIVTAEQALELLRILLTAHNRYYVTAKLPTTRSFYYLYRFKKLFKEFQLPWTITTYAEGGGPSRKLDDHLASLSTRLTFICMAYDEVAFLSLKTPDYEDQTDELYHLVYLVTLTTGVFDNLAHIVKERYRLEVGDRRRIGLRAGQGNKITKFYAELQRHNQDLHAFLTASDTQRDIGIFYPLRDSLVHRELPTGVHLQQNAEPDKNVFELTNETYEELREICDQPKFIIRGNPCFLDPSSFIKWAQGVTTTLVNRVLSSLDWNSFCTTLPMDVQSKIHASKASFDHGLGHMLGWPQEPPYF